MRWILLLVLALGCESSAKDRPVVPAKAGAPAKAEDAGKKDLASGVAHQEAERFEDAVKDYDSSCAKGAAEGCVRLGILHYHGKGASKDRAKSAALYRKACEQENAWGCRNLAILYVEGTGVEQSDAEAARFYKKACTGGDSTACKYLEELPAGSETP